MTPTYVLGNDDYVVSDDAEQIIARLKKSLGPDISNAKLIPGYMAEDELMWLAARAAEHRFIVEIGSYLGRSTRALADNTEGFVVAIDDWWGPREVWIDKFERKTVFERFCKNMGELIPRKVKPIRLDHRWLRNAAARFAEAAVQATVQPLPFVPDMVFVDGDHEEHSVERDITIARQMLANGGLLCGHDAHAGPVHAKLEELVPGWTCPVRNIWAIEI